MDRADDIVNVLVTGGRGFLGREIVNAIIEKGWTTLTLGQSIENHNQCDLSREIPILNRSVNVVIHSAGRAHSVPKTGEERKAFEEINVKGTQNLLAGLQRMATLPEAVVFISSVSVYGLSTGNNISENEPLRATDPYGLSKI